jgi:uncharacterized protein YcbK (DUF882 family)
MQSTLLWGRRRFLAAAASAAAAAACVAAAPAVAMPHLRLTRSLAFEHLHTGERLNVVYWVEGRYQPDALERIDRLLRDFRTDDTHPIDTRLLDLLAALRDRLLTRAPLQVVSGYRSPATNAWLASLTEGVATNSLHMAGRAIDIRVPGRRLGAVRRAALGLHDGGVGFYPRSNFVHLDTGRPRRW